MMFNVFAQHRNLGIVIRAVGLLLQDFADKKFDAVMFDLRLIEYARFHFVLAAGGVKNFFLQSGMHDEFCAYLFRYLHLFFGSTGVLILFEQSFDRTMIGLQ